MSTKTMMVTKPDISFIIVSYNKPSYLNNLLQSICINCSDCQYEVIIVDNNSIDDLRSIANNFEHVNYIQQDENLGFGRANNRGVLEARSDVICLINLDAKLLVKGSELLKYVYEYPDSIISGFMADYNSDDVKPSFGYFPDKIKYIIKPSLMYDQFFLKKFSTKNFNVDWIEGSFLLLNRRVWEKIGGFDSRIFMYGEDIVLSKQAEALGVKRVVVPEILYAHEGGFSPERAHLIYKGFLSYMTICYTGSERVRMKFKFYFGYFIKLTLFLFLSLFSKDKRKKFKVLLKVVTNG